MLLLSGTWLKRLRETWWLNSEMHELELTSMLLMLDGMLLRLVISDVVCNWKFWLKTRSGELTLTLVLTMLFGITEVIWYCLSPLVMLVKELVASNVWDWLGNSKLNRFTLNSRNCSDGGTCAGVFSEFLYSFRLPFAEAPRRISFWISAARLAWKALLCLLRRQSLLSLVQPHSSQIRDC